MFHRIYLFHFERKMTVSRPHFTRPWTKHWIHVDVSGRIQRSILGYINLLTYFESGRWKEWVKKRDRDTHLWIKRGQTHEDILQTNKQTNKSSNKKLHLFLIRIGISSGSGVGWAKSLSRFFLFFKGERLISNCLCFFFFSMLDTKVGKFTYITR